VGGGNESHTVLSAIELTS